MLMNQFEIFSKSPGMVVNKSKCSVYCGGVSEEMESETRRITGFCKGTPPLKYLGVHLDDKKLTVSTCLPLIEKIVSRIKHRSGTLLSYAGRVQLIKECNF